jgi:hypothetical protein
MRFCPVSEDWFKLLNTGLARFVIGKELWFDSSTLSSLAAA